MTIDDSLGHPWIKVSPLFADRTTSKEEETQTVLQPFDVGEFRTMHGLIPIDRLVDVDDSRSHTEIFSPDF